ncbi:MAG: phosphatase PAP2 family protein [Dehalococcoidia bacterium]|jgi:hypothetical protein
MHALRRSKDVAKPVGKGGRVASWQGTAHLREFGIVGGAYLLYMLIRQIISADINGVAFIHAEHVMNLEKDLGFFWEPALQSWAIETSDTLVVFFNWAYILTFYPIIVTASIILYMKSKHRYRYYRNVVFLSFLFALVAFAIFPLAPPRMLTKEFVDTMAIFGPAIYSGAEGASFYNAFAAMPSLHFGWSVLFATIFFRSGSRFLRIFAFIYPSMMLFTIVVTGNHYFLDAIAGGFVIVISFGTVNVIGAFRRGELRPSLLISKTSRALETIRGIRHLQPDRGMSSRGSQPEQQITGQQQYDRDYQRSVYVSTAF